jgi:pyruvate,water dikinase
MVVLCESGILLGLSRFGLAGAIWTRTCVFSPIATRTSLCVNTAMTKITNNLDDFVLPLEKVRIVDVSRVGGKNASLGAMISALTAQGVSIPPGFATTAAAYRHFLQANALQMPLEGLFTAYRSGKATLRATGRAVRELILSAALPEELAIGISEAYQKLSSSVGTGAVAVAVRSSATAEDLPDASFAGQQDTFLNVVGEAELLSACQRCYASLFTDRAISYREAKGFDHLAIALSVGVQLMVRSDLWGSGVMFSIDPESGFPDVAVISAAWGLGETVVQGSVDPDTFMVFKPLLADGALRPIIDKRLGGKAQKLVYKAEEDAGGTVLVETNASERNSYVLTDDEAMQLARWAQLIETHYGRPMDMEWAKDGLTGALYIVQARPETVQSNRSAERLTHWKLQQRAEPFATGGAVGEAIASGPVAIVRTTSDLADFPSGAVMFAESTDPDWVPAMRRAAGVVTDRGGSTSHAAIVARELGVPAVVGTGNATKLVVPGEMVTISCAEGDRAKVYRGALTYEQTDLDVGSLTRTDTALMLNIANPASAFQWWRLPSRGVGLARMEFIISNLIRIHPMALAHPERVTDPSDRKQIAQITHGWADPREFFVETLARGIGRIAAGCHPEPAIVRMSDFKTNEYAHLLGGKYFEGEEANPMIGFRGASRYYHERYRDGFALECAAMKRAREVLGFRNIILMIPFCRTPEEADHVFEELEKHGLRRGEGGLQIYVMAEIPSNIILAEEFSDRFDGFSIGSNDLTQLILGIDRDSDLLAPLFDERHPAVANSIASLIERAHSKGRKVGICGQAPSNYPEFAKFLVECGIDSISLNPDSFVKTLHFIAAYGQRGLDS